MYVVISLLFILSLILYYIIIFELIYTCHVCVRKAFFLFYLVCILVLAVSSSFSNTTPPTVTFLAPDQCSQEETANDPASNYFFYCFFVSHSPFPSCWWWWWWWWWWWCHSRRSPSGFFELLSMMLVSLRLSLVVVPVPHLHRQELSMLFLLVGQDFDNIHDHFHSFSVFETMVSFYPKVLMVVVVQRYHVCETYCWWYHYQARAQRDVRRSFSSSGFSFSRNFSTKLVSLRSRLVLMPVVKVVVLLVQRHLASVLLFEMPWRSLSFFAGARLFSLVVTF